MNVATLRMLAKQTKRVAKGHPWVFANEVERDDLRALAPGDAVDVRGPDGTFYGRGIVDPHNQIVCRLFAGQRDDIDDKAFWVRRLKSALEHRTRCYGTRRDLRLVDAEGDRLPGLTVDRYGHLLRVELDHPGVLKRQETIKEALQEVFDPRAAVVIRAEGEPEAWFGSIPVVLNIDENGIPLQVDPIAPPRKAHDTSQGDNRRVLSHLFEGASVLDVYSGSGAWSLAALKAGATSAVAINKAQSACHHIADGAEIAGFDQELTVVCDEAKHTLELLERKQKRYDVVILDPPRFAKSRKQAKRALQGYRDLLILGVTLTKPGGVLITSTRSVHVSSSEYLHQVVSAARNVGRRLRQIHVGTQAADHPMRPEMPESCKLRCWAFTVTTDVG